MKSFSRAEILEELKGVKPHRIWCENEAGKKIATSLISPKENEIEKKIDELFKIINSKVSAPGDYFFCYTLTSRNGAETRIPHTKSGEKVVIEKQMFSEKEIGDKVRAEIKNEFLEKENERLTAEVSELKKKIEVLNETVKGLEEDMGDGEDAPQSDSTGKIVEAISEGIAGGLELVKEIIISSREAKKIEAEEKKQKEIAAAGGNGLSEDSPLMQKLVEAVNIQSKNQKVIYEQQQAIIKKLNSLEDDGNENEEGDDKAAG